MFDAATCTTVGDRWGLAADADLNAGAARPTNSNAPTTPPAAGTANPGS